MFRHAIVREPAENFAEGLTTVDLGVPDLALALGQHAAYCEALTACGVEVVWLPPDLLHPDAPFVEDTAVLTPRSVILTRPGAESRMGEVEEIRDTIGLFYSEMHEIAEPGTLDGGDVCEVGSHYFIGISQRTNQEGARQLSRILEAEGYTTSTVDIRSMQSILHLKSGIAYIGNRTLVMMDEMAERREFDGFDRISVSASETYACNCVLVNERVLVPAGFPGVESELVRRGYATLPVEISEFRKMDGGLSCLSLRF